MLLDQAGNHIVDIMTTNRSLANIPSASAILDTSNYTFHAITYGKDAYGFKNHAHKIISPSENVIIKVVSYNENTVSSYHISATAIATSDLYKLYPSSPTPMDTRLESKSTLPVYSSGVKDVGHCINSVISPQLYSKSHLIGCFPAASGTNYWIVSSDINATNSKIVTGTLFGDYNLHSKMDSSGYLTFFPGNATEQLYNYDQNRWTSGVMRLAPTSLFPNSIIIQWYLSPGDAGSLLLFGGVTHIGLWTLDLKSMLKAGYYPPYNFNALNNLREYKLFAKKTFNQDLLTLDDFSGKSGFFETYKQTSTYNMFIGWQIKFN